MPTKFKVKRSTVSGVTPTTSDIDTAELAINLPDRKLFTSNGTAVYELGSNLTNLSVSANLNIGASGDIVLAPGAGISANGGLGTTGQVLHSNGSSIYWTAATINTAAQYAWTNTHTFAANVTFDTSTLFVDATNDEVGIGTTAPSAKLDIVGDSNIRTFETTSTISNTVATTYANYLDVNISGSDVLAADIIHAGFVVDLDSVATSGNTTTEHIVYGIWSTADVTGPSNRIYGVYSDVRAAPTVGTIGQFYGTYNLVEPDPVAGATITDVAGTFNLVASGGNGAVTTMYGTYNRTLLETTGTPTLTNGYGSYNEVEIDGNVITTAYGTRSVIDIDGGTIGTGYLYYGDYQGANTTNITSAFGLYITGETQNYISGNVGIGTTTPSQKLEISQGSGLNAYVEIGQSEARTTSTARSGILLDKTGVNQFALTIDGGVGANGVTYYEAKSATGQHIFYTDTTEKLRIAANGNVGIGNSTPTIKLTVEGDLSAYFHLNPTTINSNYTIPANYNAMVAGPITVANGITVTVSSGSTWVIT